MQLKRIGWVGFSDGKIYWQTMLDEYDLNKGFVGSDLFKTKKDARRRFEDVREVFVADKPKK